MCNFLFIVFFRVSNHEKRGYKETRDVSCAFVLSVSHSERFFFFYKKYKFKAKKILCNFAEANFLNSQNHFVFYTNIGLDQIFLEQLSFVAIGLECKNALFSTPFFILSANNSLYSVKQLFSSIAF